MNEIAIKLIKQNRRCIGARLDYMGNPTIPIYMNSFGKAQRFAYADVLNEINRMPETYDNPVLDDKKTYLKELAETILSINH